MLRKVKATMKVQWMSSRRSPNIQTHPASMTAREKTAAYLPHTWPMRGVLSLFFAQFSFFHELPCAPCTPSCMLTFFSCFQFFHCLAGTCSDIEPRWAHAKPYLEATPEVASASSSAVPSVPANALNGPDSKVYPDAHHWFCSSPCCLFCSEMSANLWDHVGRVTWGHIRKFRWSCWKLHISQAAAEAVPAIPSLNSAASLPSVTSMHWVRAHN